MRRDFNEKKWMESDEALVTVADGDDKANCLGLRLIEVVRLADAYRADLLIKAEADVNVQDEEGMTALHHAAARGARPCIRVLVGCGRCDYTIHDKQYRYASGLAIEWARDYAVARLLTKHQIRQAFERRIPAVIFPPEVEQRIRQHKLF